MRKFSDLVGITYGEFQSWYNYGEIRLSADRLVSLEVSADDESVPDATCPDVATLLSRLPQLSLEDEEGVLFVQLAPVDGTDCSCGTGPNTSRTLYIPISRVQYVIPLTERARRILKPRLASLEIRLSQPYFHKLATDRWFRMGLHNALRGGDALVDALFKAGANSIGNVLRQAVEGGIRKLDLQDSAPLAQTDTTWITEAYGYTRHDPFNKGDLNYLYDAGIVLRACADNFGKNDSILDSYREVTKDITERLGAASLSDILADSRLKEVAKQTEDNFKEVFLASLSSLIMFLRWKEVFHKHGEEIDFQGLIDDSPRFIQSAGFEPTVIAVWLLGCFAGYERIAPFVYSSDPESYPWFTGSTILITKLQKPEKRVQTQPPTGEIGRNGDLDDEPRTEENNSSQLDTSGGDAREKEVEKSESTAKVEIDTATKETEISDNTSEKKLVQGDKVPKSSGQDDLKTNEEKAASEGQGSTQQKRGKKATAKKKATKKAIKKANSPKGRKKTLSKSEPTTSDRTNATTKQTGSEEKYNSRLDSNDANSTPGTGSGNKGTTGGPPNAETASHGQLVDSDKK